MQTRQQWLESDPKAMQRESKIEEARARQAKRWDSYTPMQKIHHGVVMVGIVGLMIAAPTLIVVHFVTTVIGWF